MKLILFSHHKVDELTIERFNEVKKLNPNWDVIPIGFEGYKLLKCSIITNKEKYPSNKDIQYFASYNHLDWFDPDLFLYEGYIQRPNYDEYFLYEYDTKCNVSVESFFNTDVDFFGNGICNPANETWDWVKLYRKHNVYNIRFPILYAYGQSTCIYFKNHILKQCVNEVIKNKHLYNNMLSELRGGTLVSQFTTLKKGRDDIEKYISWNQNLIEVDISKDYFYHPVKKLFYKEQ
jgi:hypothetical protein